MSRGLTARRGLPAIVALVAAVVVALAYDVQVGQIARFGFATLWSVLLPGYLVLRWCRPRGRTLFEDVCVAFIVGIMVQLVAWAVLVGAGFGAGLILYPAVLLAVGILVPALRRRLHVPPYTERVPGPAAWVMTAAYAFMVTMLGLRTFSLAPLPPGSAHWYQDLYWHLAISAEARHSVPPQVPQVAGQTLKYHWFSNAHMAADSLVGHLSVMVVTMRLWYLPVIAVTVAMTYLLATRMARTPKAGVVAVALLVIGASFNPVHWLGGLATNSFVPLSPSEMLGLPVLLLVTWWLADLVRGARWHWPAWVLLALLLLTCAGAKSSNLPVLIGGLILVLVVSLLQRRLSWRTASAAGMVVVALVGTAPFLAGGSAASKIELLSIAHYVQHRLHEPVMGFLPHLVGTSVILLLIAVAILIQFAGVLLAIPLLKDPAAVLMVGIVAAGGAAMFLIDHPSLSEAYFMLGVLPILDVLIAWGFAVVWHRAGLSVRRRRELVPVLGAAVAGVLITYGLRLLGTSHLATWPDQLRAVLAIGIAVLALVWVTLVLTRTTGRAGRLRLIAVTALLAAVMVPSTVATATTAVSTVPPEKRPHLTSAEIAGTTWLRRHVPADDLVATNVHCVNTRTTPHCDSRAFWVTGLGEHQAFVESWGYTDEAQATASAPLAPGQVRIPYAKQNFFDPARLRLNDSAFSAPTRAGLDQLYRDGVRVLFADAGAAHVSGTLQDLATRVFHQRRVTIYRLRAPG